MYWEHVLLHDSNKSYYDAVQKVDEQLELRNITDQVYELAYIAHKKIKALQKTRAYILTVILSWIVGIFASRALVKMGG